ncbi:MULTISPECIES: NAD(P)-dependent alcohol dehydrogenase [Stenotrophomonas]|uniref:NAD(P)-dependent alcohol dehydrogenase n=1 Tax=Stenotrophomonas TaxID=40323 RepID=UPI000871C3F5|nr:MULTISPECIES: NAD(P)-dependent alcohol dehydrogenase [Stenotrophomonas]OEY99810.1 zinc-binding dehydrogenase [Stenotrophomonas sp. BIIR7]
MTITAYGAGAADEPLAPMPIKRRATGPKDVRIAVAYCGICHSDLHQVRGEWQGTIYPCVPGHEIVGEIIATGSEVTGFAVGDVVGVGCMVDSCGHCGSCSQELEQYCENGTTFTYNSPIADAPGHTLGGYSQEIVVAEHFVLRIRHDRDQLAAVAPLLCAGITTWSPLRREKVGPGRKVGIVGIGGLGHMGVKLANALGAQVVAFTTSPGKVEAARMLGAHEVVVSRNSNEMAAHANSFDFILDTVAATHSLDDYLVLLAKGGTLTLVGAPEHPNPEPDPANLLDGRTTNFSMIGGIAETQEMLDFCAEHGIVSDIEMIAAQGIESAYERMLKGDVKYRFVMDAATLAN